MKNPDLAPELAAEIDRMKQLIAQNLSDLLEENRWSLRAAATRLGLTHTYVTNRANGTVELSGSDLALFATFLKVPVSRFFDEPANDDKPTPPVVRLAPNRPLSDYSADHLAPVTPIFAARADEAVSA